MLISLSNEVQIAWIAFGSAVGVGIIGGPLMWFLNRLDKRSAEKHQGSMDQLSEIKTAVQDLDRKFDSHILWHAHTDPRPTAPVVALHPDREPAS